MNNKRGFYTEKLVAGRSILFLLCLVCLFSFVSIHPASAVPSHLDKKKVKGGCSQCHKGHGQKGTPLLKKDEKELCLDCHGPSGKTATDIQSEGLKPSKHPFMQTGRYHIAGEELPEKTASQQRHVSCFDCHNVHTSEKGQPLKGLRGYSGRGAKVNQVQHEHELCYKCHSDSANLSGSKSNISLDFSASNASFHPVETYGRRSFLPSMKGGMSSSSLIKCTDCHGNDNRWGPKGPHGSIYPSLLKYRYNRTQGVESPNSYELCYSCHNRSSILADESFKAHKTHVVYNLMSCAQCHVSHGSKMNVSLIGFDNTSVFPTTKGELFFMPGSQGRPRCLLSCHLNSGKTYEHRLNDKLQYCINTTCPPSW